MTLFSYIVVYDSGFAPNPFYGYCTLATCKPEIRARAQPGDWVVGFASANRKYGRAGHVIYAMRVEETMTFENYRNDARFAKKIPYRMGSLKQSSGDNIYSRQGACWHQDDSYHSLENGQPNLDHITRDTSVNRVLTSTNFAYFGGYGPKIPNTLEALYAVRRRHLTFPDKPTIDQFEEWYQSSNERGLIGAPTDWKKNRGKPKT